MESLEEQLRKLKTQSDELTRNNSDLTNSRTRLNQENAELQRQIHDLENNCGSFSKTKSQLQIQLEETKAKLEEEARVSFCQLLHLTLFTRKNCYCTSDLDFYIYYLIFISLATIQLFS